MTIKTNCIICLCLVLNMTLFATSKSVGIIPAPQSVEMGKGAFVMKAPLNLCVDAKSAPLTELVEHLTKAGVSTVVVGDNAPQNYLKLICGVASMDAEGYELVVDRNGVTISAAQEVGLFYGVQSLLQLIQKYGNKIPVMTIKDAPRFEYRGRHMDVSRNFFPKEEVKKQLDMMAYYKLNKLHWHLTDAAGWRLEIKGYPLLTEVGAWRPFETYLDWYNGNRSYCRQDEPGARGGFFTQDDVREVLEYARKLHITVIPEIEMPGHSTEVTTLYPELSCSGKPYVDEDVCIGSEATFKFFEDVLSQVIELFPSKYIHIGGDEAVKSSWRTCPKCQARMKDEGFTDIDQLQSYMIHRIEVFLNSKGRDLLGWDEILEGGLAPNATVMSWRGVEGGIAAAKAGHKAVMTPTSYCYLDYYQDAPPTQPLAMPAFVTLEKAYSYDPAPDSLAPDVRKMILGVQGNVWAEYITTPEHMDYMVWPRLLAIAEVGWTNPEHKSYPEFRQRALHNIEFLRSRGYNPFDLKNEVGPRKESLRKDKHHGVGAQVTYKHLYGDKYTGGGVHGLTDGVRGGWSYGDGLWQGFLNCDMSVTLDLGEVKKVSRVEAQFLQNYTAWIWMPAEVVVEGSLDGVTYSELGRMKNDVAIEDYTVCYRDYGWKGKTEARYIRFTAVSNARKDGWIFTDEVRVK